MSDRGSPYDIRVRGKRISSTVEKHQAAVDVRISRLVERITALEAAVAALQKNQPVTRDDKNG